jgi:hypothetical protein
MMRYDLPATKWRKSSRSADTGSNNCLEAQITPDGLVAVGDSKDRALGAFVFASEAWACFIAGVKAKNFPVA